MLLDRIALFINVAHHQSVAKTARGMHVSPSSVSQRLKSLERDFGVKLYRRNKDGIELTNEGRMLLSTASEVMSQINTLREKLNPNSDKGVERRLVVGATYTPSARYLPAVIAAFQKAHSDVSVTFLTSYRREVEKWVRDGEVDVAIIQSPSQSCIADCATEPVVEDTVAFFAHACHPLAKKQKLWLCELGDAPLIVRAGRGTTHKMLNALQSRGLKLNIALRCAFPEAVKAAVRNKIGIGLLFHKQIMEDVKRKDFKILKFADSPRIVATSYIVHTASGPLNSPAADFVEMLRDLNLRRGKPANAQSSATK
jgi:DNA-binding transcriptional LysR family regulator